MTDVPQEFRPGSSGTPEARRSWSRCRDGDSHFAKTVSHLSRKIAAFEAKAREARRLE